MTIEIFPHCFSHDPISGTKHWYLRLKGGEFILIHSFRPWSDASKIEMIWQRVLVAERCLSHGSQEAKRKEEPRINMYTSGSCSQLPASSNKTRINLLMSRGHGDLTTCQKLHFWTQWDFQRHVRFKPWHSSSMLWMCLRSTLVNSFLMFSRIQLDQMFFFIWEVLKIIDKIYFSWVTYNFLLLHGQSWYFVFLENLKVSKFCCMYYIVMN